jgi:hypothetical protein
MEKIARNMSFKFYPKIIPIYGYMVSGVWIQLPGASVLTPETRHLLQVGMKMKSKFKSI